MKQEMSQGDLRSYSVYTGAILAQWNEAKETPLSRVWKKSSKGLGIRLSDLFTKIKRGLMKKGFLDLDEVRLLVRQPILYQSFQLVTFTQFLEKVCANFVHHRFFNIVPNTYNPPGILPPQ